jgi:alpha-glucosidase
MAKNKALQFYLNLGGRQLVDDIKTSDKEIERHNKRFGVKKRRPSPWQTVGAVRRMLEYGHGLLLVCERALVELHWIAADCIRVRLRTVKGDFSTPFSYAVAKTDWPMVPIEILEGAEVLEVRSAAMVCRIGKRPFRISIETLDGDPICIDGAGMRWQVDGTVGLSLTIHPDESCYGLGERASSLNLRGKRLELWNHDPWEYGWGTDPLYFSIPFYLGVHSNGVYGLLWDNASRGSVDLGAATANEISFEAEGGELCYYLFAGKDVNTILSRYTELTGRINLPPLWALGYHQSRFSYPSQDAVLKLAADLRDRNIPCDAIYLDIHYMDGFRAFTWSRERFTGLRQLITELHTKGFKVVAALNPGIKADPHYPAYNTGISQDVFLKYPDGEPFSAASWPGISHFPDFTRSESRSWWVERARELVEAGIDGFSNGMGEPTVLTTEGVRSLPDYIPYDNDGRGADFAGSHNVYGMLMGCASLAALEQHRPAHRQWNLSRAGFAGAQRYAASWTGSNASDWDHLRLSVSMTLNMGMSGAPMTGAAVGGFRGNADGELFTRWLQAACLMPLFFSHSAPGTLQHEPWSFGQPYEIINRVTIQLRYRLLLYLYSVVAQCKEFGWPVVRPLFMAEPDNPNLRSVDDCYMLGDAILVAPVLEPGAVSRSVYLPTGQWYDYWTNELLDGGQDLVVTAPLERLPLFVRAGTVLPVLPEMQFTGQATVDTLTLRVYPGRFETVLYEDRGEGMDFAQGDYRWVYVTCNWEESRLTIDRRVAGKFEPGYSKIKLEVVAFDEEPMEVRVDRQGAPLWFYDDELLELTVDPFGRVEIRRKPRPTDRTILRRPW